MLTLDRIWVHDTKLIGIYVPNDFGETTLTISGSLVESAVASGVFLMGTKVTIEGSVVRGTRELDGNFGYGIEIENLDGTAERSSATVRGCVAEGNVEHGIFVRGSDAVVEASLVRDTKQPSVSGAPSGIAFLDDRQPGTRATGTVRTSVVERNKGRASTFGGPT